MIEYAAKPANGVDLDGAPRRFTSPIRVIAPG
jgi:hypothetical protein